MCSLSADFRWNEISGQFDMENWRGDLMMAIDFPNGFTASVIVIDDGGPSFSGCCGVETSAGSGVRTYEVAPMVDDEIVYTTNITTEWHDLPQVWGDSSLGMMLRTIASWPAL